MGTLSQILSIAQSLVQPEATLRDYQHAHKIFTPNNSAFLPKTKNWFHIYFELDPTASAQIITNLASATTNGRMYWNPARIPILGILAKSVKLPTFKFDIKKSNQYNRWSLSTTKINYEAVNIDFWDDTLDIIRGFWYAYYQYMIQDPNFVNFNSAQQQGIPIPTEWTPSSGNNSSLYSAGSNWGTYYGMDTPSPNGTSLGRSAPFFRSIRIYQFNRSINANDGVQWTEYVLVNPVISSFDHDSVDFATSEYMSHKMTVEYETVLYNSGLINNSEIASWDAVLETFFDNTPSPNGGINTQLNNILQTANQGIGLVNEIQAIATNPSGATVATVLATAGASSILVNDAAVTAGSSQVISVPSVIPGFGVGGLPPNQQL